MFDLGWTELLVIGVVALIVVGPKELPMLFRKVGQFVGKAKGMAREFTRAMDQAADQSGIKEATDSFKGMASAKDMGLDDLKKSTEDLKNWSPESETGKLAAERAEAAKKIHEATAKKQADKRAAEDAAKADAAAAAKVKDAATPADAAKDAPDTEDKA